NTVELNGWTGADQFLLYTSDQLGGSNPAPLMQASGLGTNTLNGDAPGNPNDPDGNDVFGATPPGLSGVGAMNVGLTVSDAVRMIRPSAPTGIVINGGKPTGAVPPLEDTSGDVLHLDISG